MPAKSTRGSNASRSVDELWLDCSQRLVAFAAHDLKGALNGASVNLEVVRSRAERGDSPISESRRYAVAAADQTSVVIKMIAALLALGRANRGPVEVSQVTRQMVAAMEDTVRSDGAGLDLVVEGALSGATSAPAPAVRLAVGESLLAAASHKKPITVQVHTFPQPQLQVRSAGSPVTLSDQVIAVLMNAKITVQTDGHGISIMFPQPADTPTEEA